MNIQNSYDMVKIIKVKNAQTITFENEAPVESNLEQFMRATDIIVSNYTSRKSRESDYSENEVKKTQDLLNFYGGMI